MDSSRKSYPIHPRFPRRTALQAGAIGLLGLGTNHLDGLHALATQGGNALPVRAKSVIYIFLSGGLSQLDSFDLKPNAPAQIAGEFRPIDTATPGLQICEHLPMLAQRSRHWALLRSLTHPYNEHSQGHHVMLTGRTQVPPAFNPSKPLPTDYPSLAAIAGYALTGRNNLPPAVVLPEVLVHRTGRTIPGQFAGEMGPRFDPWVINASPYNSESYGAYPQYGFHHVSGAVDPGFRFQAPSLTLPEGLNSERLSSRMRLLGHIEDQCEALETSAAGTAFDRHRQQAISLLADPSVRRAFDVQQADPATRERYGENNFGWSLLMARRLVESGVRLVQVNLGNNETWDNHQFLFRNLRDFLFPPTDRALSALIDDLHNSGQLEETLIVMAGEFGRTPRLSALPGSTNVGRDHWGAVQTVFFAGGGIRGGRVIGSSDRTGGYPHDLPQTPDNLGATIYSALGIPQTAAWHDVTDRPHFIYHGEPIRGLV